VPCRKQKLQASSLTSTVPSKPPAPRSSAIHRPIRPLPVGVPHARLTLVSVLALTLTHPRPPTVAGFPFLSLLPLPSFLPFFLLLPSLFSLLNLTLHTSNQLIDSHQGSLVLSTGPLTSSYSLPSQRVFHHLYHPSYTRATTTYTQSSRRLSHPPRQFNHHTHQRTNLACDKAVYSLL
jgi:hypothetical protein